MADKKEPSSRRDFLKHATLATGAAALTLEEKILLAAVEKNKPAAMKGTPTGEMPMGKIGHLKVSRMICGGNVLSGYSHSRDLIYVSSLMRNYNTEEKVMDTLELCEEHGINTYLVNPTERTRRIIKTYWRSRGGDIQWFVDSRPQPNDIKTGLNMAIDAGAAGIYVNGEWSGKWVRQGKTELLGKVVDYVRERGLVAGIGGHELAVVVACEKMGIQPDFYMKTFHSKNYWSAEHAREHDNIWCRKPEETIEVMKKVTVPWIAFKTLAAGAIHPRVGFEYALKNGADFLCVGMFDFQVTEDVLIFNKLFAKGIERERPWRA